MDSGNQKTPREIVLVRHGQTTGESSIRLYGATDIALSDLGRLQMQRASHALEHESFDQVVTSPRSRAQESTRLILNGRGPEPLVSHSLREVDFGRWEGWTEEEVEARDPEAHRQWRTSGLEFAYPGGDRRQDFWDRVGAEAARLAAGDFCRALWVLHKGVIKVILHALVGLDVDEMARVRVDLGSIHRLHHQAGAWRLASSNEVAHLGDSLSPDP